QALPWREPAPANRLLSELRSDGLVVEVDRYGQPGGPPAWRLSDEGHLVATVCAVLAAPAMAPERTVKVLAAAMALARAAGVDERAAFAPFVAAPALLERDLAALHPLLDPRDDPAPAPWSANCPPPPLAGHRAGAVQPQPRLPGPPSGRVADPEPRGAALSTA